MVLEDMEALYYIVHGVLGRMEKKAWLFKHEEEIAVLKGQCCGDFAEFFFLFFGQN